MIRIQLGALIRREWNLAERFSHDLFERSREALLTRRDFREFRTAVRQTHSRRPLHFNRMSRRRA